MRAYVACALLVLTAGVLMAVPPAQPAQPAAVPLTQKAAEMQQEAAQLQLLRLQQQPVPIDYLKEQDARRQWNYEFVYKIVVSIAAIALLIWLLPHVSSLSLPFGGGVLQITTLPPTPPPPTPVAPTGGIQAKAAGVKAPPDPQEEAQDKVKELATLASAGVLPDALHLEHTVRFARGALPLVEVRLQGDATALAKVVKVVYHLHPSLSATPITSTERASGFSIRFMSSGEFMLYAFAFLGDNDHPIRLKRYINLRAAA